MRYFFATACGLILLATASCQLTPDFPDTPEIKPNAVTVTNRPDPNGGGGSYADIDIAVDFTDGDGDLGEVDDTLASTPAKYNFYLKLYKKVGSDYPQAVTAGRLDGLFTVLAPDDQKQPLRGTIHYVQNLFLPSTVTINGRPVALKRGDVIRYEVYVKDRAGHQSNTITTQDATL